jgi:hypothetical protein
MTSRTSPLLLTALILASAFANASLPLGPDSWVEVQPHGKAAEYVLTHLETAATANGMICDHALARLSCQFEPGGYSAIQPSVGPQVVSIFFYYQAGSDDDSPPDPSRRYTIDLVVRQFVNSLRQSSRVEKIVLCEMPQRYAISLCEGRLLLDRRAKP